MARKQVSQKLHSSSPMHKPLSELTKRQRSFLKAAYSWGSGFDEQAENGNREELVLDICDISDRCGIPENDGRDIAAILENHFGLMFKTDAFSAIRKAEHRNNPELIYRIVLTDLGREWARQLHDDDKSARRARAWGIIKGIWAITLTIFVAVISSYLKGRIERLEHQQVTTQPTK